MGGGWAGWYTYLDAGAGCTGLVPRNVHKGHCRVPCRVTLAGEGPVTGSGGTDQAPPGHCGARHPPPSWGLALTAGRSGVNPTPGSPGRGLPHLADRGRRDRGGLEQSAAGGGPSLPLVAQAHLEAGGARREEGHPEVARSGRGLDGHLPGCGGRGEAQRPPTADHLGYGHTARAPDQPPACPLEGPAPLLGPRPSEGPRPLEGPHSLEDSPGNLGCLKGHLTWKPRLVENCREAEGQGVAVCPATGRPPSRPSGTGHKPPPPTVGPGGVRGAARWLDPGAGQGRGRHLAVGPLPQCRGSLVWLLRSLRQPREGTRQAVVQATHLQAELGLCVHERVLHLGGAHVRALAIHLRPHHCLGDTHPAAGWPA